MDIMSRISFRRDQKARWYGIARQDATYRGCMTSHQKPKGKACFRSAYRSAAYTYLRHILRRVSKKLLVYRSSELQMCPLGKLGLYVRRNTSQMISTYKAVTSSWVTLTSQINTGPQCVCVCIRRSKVWSTRAVKLCHQNTCFHWTRGLEVIRFI